MKTLLSLALALVGWSAAQADDVVVAELFTSQGCSSCPPADRVLSELAERDDVLALSLPVTYWDHLGWDDTFARKDHAARQRAYALRLEGGRVYTPQLIVDGRRSLIGSRREAVERGVRAAKREKSATVSLQADRRGDDLHIRAADHVDGGEIMVVTYRPGHASVNVRRGENAGRRLAYVNVVTAMRRLGRIKTDRPFEATVSAPRADGDGPLAYAVMVQDGRTGPVTAALKLD